MDVNNLSVIEDHFEVILFEYYLVHVIGIINEFCQMFVSCFKLF